MPTELSLHVIKLLHLKQADAPPAIPGQSVMVHLIHLIHTPPTISDHLRLHLPTLRCHSNAHCISLHNHATPVAGPNSDQCLISPDLVPMSWATTYLSFSPYAAFA